MERRHGSGCCQSLGVLCANDCEIRVTTQLQTFSFTSKANTTMIFAALTKKIVLAAGAVAAVGFVAAPANAAVLGRYTFEVNSLAASDVASGVTLSNFGYTSNDDDTASFATGNAPTAATAYLADSWDAGDFFSFTVTPGTNVLTSITLDARRGVIKSGILS